MSVQMDQHARKTTRNNMLWLWAPIAGYCILIFMGSAQHDLSPPDFPSSDKVAHFLEYSVLGLLWARAVTHSWPHWTFRLLLMSTLFFTGCYGITDEWHQLYVPGRSSDWHDALADICGGTSGGLIYMLGTGVSRKRASVPSTPTV